MQMRVSLTLNQIVQKIGGTIAGEGELEISKVGSLALAQQGAIGFFNDTKYTAQLNASQVSAVVIKLEHQTLTSLPKIITDNPYAYFAKVSQLLNPLAENTYGVHTSAVIDPTAIVPKRCSIAANVVVGSGVVLNDGVVIGAGSVVEHDSIIGENTVLEANVTIKHGSLIGRYCHFHSGSVIGNDGFGYAEENNENSIKRWVKIPQVGSVIIDDHVDVGANTTIDRGAIDNTVIEEGVKLDNLIQIAHNCRVGAHTVIAGCVGVAGSAVIGKHCKIGGAAMILGHLTIADHVTISPGTMIMKSIQKSGVYTALMPVQEHTTWLKTAVNIRHLSQLTDRIKTLETAIADSRNINKP